MASEIPLSLSTRRGIRNSCRSSEPSLFMWTQQQIIQVFYLAPGLLDAKSTAACHARRPDLFDGGWTETVLMLFLIQSGVRKTRRP